MASVYSIQTGMKLSENEVKHMAQHSFSATSAKQNMINKIESNQRAKPRSIYASKNCDRCSKLFGNHRKISYFNLDMLCPACEEDENDLKKQLLADGHSVRHMEGCGYLPTINNPMNNK